MRVRRVEAATTRRQSFSSAWIPGILQADEYVSVLLQDSGVSPERLQEAVAERVLRGKVLDDPGKTFEFIMSYSAIGLHFGGPDVMARQLQHLALKVKEGKHFIGILPPCSPLSANNSFSIMDSEVVWIDIASGLHMFYDEFRVSNYVRLFRQLREKGKLITDVKLYNLLVARASKLSELQDWPEQTEANWAIT
jgi:hypothetical protein